MESPSRFDADLERYARRRARLADARPDPDFAAPVKRVRRTLFGSFVAATLMGVLAFAIAWTVPGSYDAFKRWVARTPVLQDIFDDEGAWQIPLP